VDGMGPVTSLINATDDSKRHRSIYLLPNMFTAAALFAGFYAIVAAIHDHFEPAAISFRGSLLFLKNVTVHRGNFT
jgi:CDP-diacylglycerol--serine O-phosphatidyltransferase